MVRPFVALGSGVFFGLGLIISGMVNPAKVLAFLDFTGGHWDPSLALVLLSAVAVAALGSALAKRRGAPLFAPSFSGPSKQVLDPRLILGASLFGIGWGLVGYCPGPALTALGLMAPAAPFFIAAMLAGMMLFSAFDRPRSPAPGRV